MSTENTSSGKKDLKLRTYRFSVAVVRFISSIQMDKKFYPIINQLLRSATSIGANVIEGGSASSRKDMTNFYHYALKSSNETMYWLCLVRDGIEIKDERLQPLLNEAKELTKILAACILKLKKPVLTPL